MNEPFDLRTFQLKLLDILTEVDKVCRTHDIRYYITAGTLLGAVRHKGFIPWDDDIDIAMPRPDYERFISHAKKWLKEPLELASPEHTDHYPFAFAKIQDEGTTLLERRKLQYVGGLCIDVFPLDGIPANRLKQFLMFLAGHFYGKILYFVCRDPYKHGKGLRSWPSLVCRKYFKREKLQKALKRVRSKYPYDKCNYVIDHDFPMKRGIAPKTFYGNGSLVPFEGKTFIGASCPDKLLRLFYGDYMAIPPHSKQIQHKYRVVRFNQSYHDYHEQL